MTSETTSEQRKLLFSLQSISNKPILVQHHLRDTWHPWQECAHDAEFVTRSILLKEIVFDFDTEDWSVILEEGGKLISYLQKNKIPHLLAWSGGKGVHIHIFIDSASIEIEDDLGEELIAQDIDIPRVVREHLAEHIISGAHLDKERAKLDWGKVRWSSATKGSLIRMIGARRDNGAQKTLLDSIPSERPTPGSLPLRFPQRIDLWNAKKLNRGISSALSKEVGARRSESFRPTELEGAPSILPCYNLIMKGVPHGSRNHGAFALSVINLVMGVSLEKARACLQAYSHACSDCTSDVEREHQATVEGVYKRGGYKGISCRAIRANLGDEFCDRDGCPLFKNEADEVSNEIEQKPMTEEEKAIALELARRAEEVLRDGTWKEYIVAALGELIAGELALCWTLIYSALSSQFDNERLHNLMLGESQFGKSYIQRQVAENLFISILIMASSMSPKAIYYRSKQEKNPHILDKKLFLIDEAGDLAEATRDLIKQMASNGQRSMVNMTVDDKKRYREQHLEGMPVFWTNSMEVFKDIGKQLLNRFLKTNVDESMEQSLKVEAFQKEDMSFADLRRRESAVPLARAIMEKIMEEGGFTLLNLFADLIEQSDHAVRNRLPMFKALVSAIAYANRFGRPSFQLTDGRKYLLATLSDNLEALELWGKFSGPQSTGLPTRHQRVLSSLTEGIEYTVEQATDVYNAQCAKGDRISSKTMSNYLSELSEKNLVTSDRHRDDFGNLSRGYYYQKIPGISPTSSQLRIRTSHRNLEGMLDSKIEDLKQYVSQQPTDIPDDLFPDLREKLIDAEFPPPDTIQIALPDTDHD